MIYSGDIIEPNADVASKVDPYVKVDFAGCVIKTKHIDDNDQPEWSEKLYVPLCLPIATDKILLQVWDYDSTDYDDKICSH